MIRHLLPFILFSILWFNAKSQCKTVKPFSPSTVNEINFIYQLTFLQYPPQNKLDSLVCALTYPMYVLDSAYYAWPSPETKIRSAIDYFNWSKVIEEIGRTKQPEACFLLMLPYFCAEQVSFGNHHRIEDLSPFNSLMSSLPYYSASKVLNTYFLNHSVNESLPKDRFENEVILQCKKKWSNQFKQIHYCIPLEGDEYALAEMEKENPSACDSAILPIIHKYIHKQSSMHGSYSMDSILIDVNQLIQLIDVETDQCIPKVVGDDHITYTELGVIYHISEDFITKQKKYIERVYTISNHPERGQWISNIRYQPNFIAHIRQTCNDD